MNKKKLEDLGESTKYSLKSSIANLTDKSLVARLFPVFILVFSVLIILILTALLSVMGEHEQKEKEKESSSIAMPITFTAARRINNTLLLHINELDLDMVSSVVLNDSLGKDIFTFIRQSVEIDMQLPLESDGASLDVQTSMPQLVQSNYNVSIDTSSRQYALNQQMITDSEGFRRLNGKYSVAMGTYYGDIGDYVVLEYDNLTIEAVIGEIKSDAHTDPKHQFTSVNGVGCVTEFIVDTLPRANENIATQKFGTLRGIKKGAVPISMRGEIAGESIRITGTFGSISVVMSGHLNVPNMYAGNGVYGANSTGTPLILLSSFRSNVF